ncbi:MAG: hypothetical protein KDA96_24680, partial [Planctomycetaceae bacterium]|nr:hypothetical protein [Planctomycetaceae bacterium]
SSATIISPQGREDRDLASPRIPPCRPAVLDRIAERAVERDNEETTSASQETRTQLRCKRTAWRAGQTQT